jgi:hypothetical protein
MHKVLHKLTKSCTNFSQIYSLSRICQTQLFSSFAYKDFAFEKVENTGTLSTRLLRYLLLERTKERELIKREVRYSDFFPVHREQEFIQKLANCPTNQLARTIVYSSIYKNGSELNSFVFVVNNLDNICASKVEAMDIPEILQIMNAFMYVLPGKLLRLDFYRLGIQRMIEMFQGNENIEDFLKICFYLGMWKRNKFGSELSEKFMTQHLRKYLDESLTTTDFAVICHSLFKTSVKMANNEKFRQRLESEIVNMEKIDDSLLITFIKSARLTQLCSREITEKLRTLILNGTEFRFVGYVHILAYFADNLIMDEEVIPILLRKCMDTIFSANKPWQDELHAGEVRGLDNVRGKDLSNFLWACAHLNLDFLEESHLKEISKIVEYKIENYEYHSNHNVLTDTILSLWMLRHKCEALVTTMLTNKIFNRPANVEKFKLETRKQLLITAVDIEAPEILERCKINRSQPVHQNAAAPEYLVKNRKELQKVAQILEDNVEKLNLKVVKFVAQIKHLNIAGILIETENNRKINIEVLEKEYLLTDNVTWMGIFALKSRLLKASGCQTITVRTLCKIEKKIDSKLRKRKNFY